MKITNLQPVLEEGITPVFKGAFSAFTFPFAEIVVFTMTFSSLNPKKSYYKVYTIGLIIGGIIVFTTSISNILALGVNLAESEYFPTYRTFLLINIGEIIQKLRIVVATVFTLGGFIQISVYFMAACKGVTKIFNFKDYRFLVLPVCLTMINLSYLEFESIMEYFEYGFKIWPYYALPFEVFLPIVILIAAEIKVRKI